MAKNVFPKLFLVALQFEFFIPYSLSFYWYFLDVFIFMISKEQKKNACLFEKIGNPSPRICMKRSFSLTDYTHWTRKFFWDFFCYFRLFFRCSIIYIPSIFVYCKREKNKKMMEIYSLSKRHHWCCFKLTWKSSNCAIYKQIFV